MQTFLPFSSFQATAKCLDNKRLNKQIIECGQILVALERRNMKNNYGRWRDKATDEWQTRPVPWGNHPAVIMWIGYTGWLRFYRNIMVYEWRARGYKSHAGGEETSRMFSPWWLGNKDFHESHRGNLLRKNFSHYSQFFFGPQYEGYLWPSVTPGEWIDKRKPVAGTDGWPRST